MENPEDLKKMIDDVEKNGGVVKYRRRLLTEDHFMPSELLDKKVGVVMTQNRIYYNLEAPLKQGDCYANFVATNFLGRVWFDVQTQQFKCEVWRKRIFLGTMFGPTLDQLRTIVCNVYGWA